MSPLVTTFAGASVRPYGWAITSIGNTFWLARLTGAGVATTAGRAVDASSSGASFTFPSGNVGFVTYDGILSPSTQLAVTSAGPAWYTVKNHPDGNIVGSVATNVIAKVSKTGTVAWQKTTNASWGNTNIGIATSGNIYIAQNNSTSSGTFEVYKLDSTGAAVWAVSNATGTTLSGLEAAGLAIDSSENIYVARMMKGSTGGAGCALTKLNSSGTVQWSKSNYTTASALGGWYWPANNNQPKRPIQVDGAGNVYALMTSGLNGSGTTSLYKYDSSGTQLWNRTLTQASTTTGDLAVDSAGNSYVMVYASNSFVIAKYDSTSAIQWQRSFSAAYLIPETISVDPYGGIYITGEMGPSISTYTPFIFRYPASGSKTGTWAVSGTNLTIAASSMTDAAGSYTHPTATLTYGTLTYTPGTGSKTFGTVSNPISTTVI